MVMFKKLFLSTALCALISGQIYAQGDPARELFITKCVTCHTIGMGVLIGPDLANVQKRRTDTWLLNYVRSSQKLITSGDKDAVALFKEFNEVVMPDPMITDAEIRSILTFIAKHSPPVVPNAKE